MPLSESQTKLIHSRYCEAVHFCHALVGDNYEFHLNEWKKKLWEIARERYGEDAAALQQAFLDELVPCRKKNDFITSQWLVVAFIESLFEYGQSQQ